MARGREEKADEDERGTKMIETVTSVSAYESLARIAVGVAFVGGVGLGSVLTIVFTWAFKKDLEMSEERKKAALELGFLKGKYEGKVQK